MGLTWEEVEASAQDRHSWRQRVAYDNNNNNNNNNNNKLIYIAP